MGRTIREALQWASSFLEKEGREANAANWMLRELLGLSSFSELILREQDVLTEGQNTTFTEWVHRHANGEPIQHLYGYEWFYGRKFTVNSHVLIPRPETEELVVAVLEETSGKRDVTVVDVGVGSGAIAVTLQVERPEWQVFATDLSSEALQVARVNAQSLEAGCRFFEGDLLTPLVDAGQQVDVIVSNPPYIAHREAPDLSDTVRDYEPHLALFAEEDGLEAYRRIIKQSPAVLRRHGILAFEIGYTQAEAVSHLILRTYPEATVIVKQDINGKDRIVMARI